MVTWMWWIGLAQLTVAIGLRLAGEDDAANAALSLALWMITWLAAQERRGR